MKIFLSALENNNARLDELGSMHYNLMSYYYIPKNPKRALGIIEQSERIMIDSGAHTFQKGKTKLNWEEYTESYARFIRENDCNKIVGYFEMDVDKVIGLERVIKLRRRLEQETDKIIPVWHKGRGIENFYRMCEEYSGRVVAITGFKNEDIKDDQYAQFLKIAWQHNCRVHCLGMTRKDILKKVPFDYVDSSSWTQGVLYGRLGSRKLKNEDTAEKRAVMRQRQWEAAYKEAMKMQEYYERYWFTATTRLKNSLGGVLIMLHSKIKPLIYAAMTAAIYYVLCVAIAPLSYGQIQCRISEVILLFCMHNTFAVYGYTLGCALANLTSPLGILDVIVGSLANLIVGSFARKCGKALPTVLFGAVFNGIVVGAELSIVYGSPFLLNAVCVAAGEAVSLLVGALLYHLVGKRLESIWR